MLVLVLRRVLHLEGMGMHACHPQCANRWQTLNIVANPECNEDGGQVFCALHHTGHCGDHHLGPWLRQVDILRLPQDDVS
jgi:hypothetical protein